MHILPIPPTFTDTREKNKKRNIDSMSVAPIKDEKKEAKSNS